ncbi:ribosome maturation factor RimP [Pseudonocardia hydrocarbonoxydans]|uniref:Ribosome maturation factor RimP n=1 Tax=Pseudonocardia hydrocarbonoxydans TaxID=76726 RepID=A0A4Y3WNY1_9PSEU|nr:ribosome maturation factor RimP [Pseudonocardia hydrocarbonoxydans]GEC19569.1 ribosome maturation factor RimP [Pseudonocardia hydrocarbonoxydans]
MSTHRPAQQGTPLHGVLEPVVVSAGFELDELDVHTVGRRHTVRLVVDADAGVGLDDIARVSRAASAELELHEDLIPGSYTLEVTSPGVDRPLTLPRHWRRNRLRQVLVRLATGDTLTARVGDAGEDSVALLVDGRLRDVRYADVAHAAVQVEFRRPPAAELRALGADEDTTDDDTTEDEDDS